MSEPGLVIPLPYATLPLSTNGARRMTHWQRRTEIALIRRAAWVAGRGQQADTPCRITLVWQVTDRRRRDPDAGSLTLKAAIDGLVDAGVIPADDDRHVVETACRIEHGDVRGVRIEVTPV